MRERAPWATHDCCFLTAFFCGLLLAEAADAAGLDLPLPDLAMSKMLRANGSG